MTVYKKRCVTYLSEDQKKELEGLFKELGMKEAEYIRRIILIHLNEKRNKK